MSSCKLPTCLVKRAVFGDPATGVAEYCKEHAPAGYVDVKSKRCEHEDCDSHPVFGVPGTKIKKFCKEHAPAGYVDVKSKRCEHENCDSRPTFGVKGTKIGKFCKEHAPAGYVDVKNKRCEHENCVSINPVFGEKGTKIGKFCKEHAPAGYVDVKSKRCEHENCDLQPTFGEKGTKIGKFCKEHAPAGYVDVKNKRCEHEDCGTGAGFNYPGYSPGWCATHRLTGMIIYPLKKCECKAFATHVLSGIYYCEEHKPIAAIEIKKSCSICCSWLDNPLVHTCDRCLETMASGGKTVKRKLKELTVKSALENSGIKISSYDTRVPEGCSAKRPDFIITVEMDYVIVLEVDEHQHQRKNYACQCEITRMKQIYFDWGIEHGKMLFIRFNPDEYKSLKDTPMVISKRLDYLTRFIRSVPKMEHPGLKVLYLFYDGFTFEAEDTDYINPYSKESTQNV